MPIADYIIRQPRPNRYKKKDFLCKSVSELEKELVDQQKLYGFETGKMKKIREELLSRIVVFDPVRIVERKDGPILKYKCKGGSKTFWIRAGDLLEGSTVSKLGDYGKLVVFREVIENDQR